VQPFSQDGGKLLRIRSEDGGASVVVMTNNAGESADAGGTSLTFRQYGDRYFLARVFITGAAGGRELPESKTEKKLRQELRADTQAGHADESKTVTVLGTVR
jgi:hypothetical protein